MSADKIILGVYDELKAKGYNLSDEEFYRVFKLAIMDIDKGFKTLKKMGMI